MKKSKASSQKRTITSIAIILTALGFIYAPVPGLQQTIVVVSGTELKEPLEELETKFEQSHGNINLELKFQGSQDIVNNYIEQKNDFKPTVLIPANQEKLDELQSRSLTQNNNDPFYDRPQAITKTMLVGIAWPERGKVLFPNERFVWQNLEQAMEKRNWQTIGGQPTWGSFDFVTTDPTRSNSGQLTLTLWAMAQLKGNTLSSTSLNEPGIQSLFSLVKRSVYQPPRSTDILLQEFIARGPNDADAATVYESIALHRWSQAGANQGKPYQIYYLDPTIETVAAAAIVRRDVDSRTAEAAKKFINFLTQSEQQQVFVRYGFRPVISGIDLKTVPNSPWTQNIPGAETNPHSQTLQPPDTKILEEIQRLWNRAN
jgi:ABC-type molybdate transport system substrate-binding protein